MARRTAKSPPEEVETPDYGVSPRAVWACVAAACVVMLGIGIWQLERTNQKLQTLRRLRQDPALGGWFQQMQEEISSPEGGPANVRTTHQIWVGTVAECRVSQDRRRQPIGVRLQNAMLVAPESGSGRGTLEEISVVDFPFHHGIPQKGQLWAFAIWTDSRGLPFIRDAMPWRPDPRR
jgi:hypothetical protein